MPIVLHGDRSIDDKVVWFIVVNALLQSLMFRDNEDAFGIEVVSDDILEVEVHCL